ncbi:DUF6088 family protein [Pseudomonas sp. P2757]|uniref:DUF6088 family protein n=1 Tax=unclassified Pseudomonas TaxID=196821 RepID=UPI003B5BDD86
MSVAYLIAQRVKRLEKGRPFVGTKFASSGSRPSVNKALSKLVLAGLLERVARGVYMRPKSNSYIGPIRPTPFAIMKVITSAKGETTQIYGAEAVRRLGLSTQMQILPTIYTSGSTREIKIGASIVRLKHVSKNRLQHAGTQVGLVLTALHYVGKQGMTEEILLKVANQLSNDELRVLLECRMPKWMRSFLMACPVN